MAAEAGHATEVLEPVKTVKSSIEMALGSLHRDNFSRAVSNVVSTEIAKMTYAQIIVGLPLASVTQDTEDVGLPRGHPLLETHKELCPGVLEKTQEFRAQFNPGLLQLDTNVRQRTYLPLIVNV